MWEAECVCVGGGTEKGEKGREREGVGEQRKQQERKKKEEEREQRALEYL